MLTSTNSTPLATAAVSTRRENAYAEARRPPAGDVDTADRTATYRRASIAYSKMWRDIDAFVRSVARHWVALIGGAVVSVCLLVWQALGGPTLSGIAVGSILVAGGLASLFRAWQEEHRARRSAAETLETLLAARPHPLLRLRVEESTVFLDVTNEGAQAVFRGRLTVAVEGKQPAHGACVWDAHGDDDGVPLAPKTAASIKVAMNVQGDDESGCQKTAWRVWCRSPKQRVWPVECGYRNVGEGDNAEFARISVELRSEPEMRQGSEVRRYRLVGGCVVDELSGERLKVLPQHVRSARRRVATFMRY